MKAKAVLFICVMSAVVLLMAYQHSQAGSESEAVGPKVGVVSIRRIFQDCKRNAKYREEAGVEQDKIVAELDKLRKEIEAEEVGLKALKVGSSDYMELMKGILEKQASLQARQEFHKKQLALKDQRWTEQLYTDILREAGEVAKQRGLDIVFANDEPEFPALSAQELMMAIRTHKVLYSGGCLDITEEVMNRVDKEK